MRQLIVTAITTLDGFVAGPGGDLMVMPFDEGFDVYALERLRAAGTLLAGRATYEGFRSYWPAVADDPSRDERQREISRVHDTLEKVVVSDSLDVAPGETWADITRVVPRDAAADTIRELTAGDGGDVLAFGSFRTWNPLLVAGLVDELHVLVGPALLGAGVPVLGAAGRVALRLLEIRRLPDSSLVLHRYDARGPR
jgi:dihydrofolate reductase